jgi:hypothetical protein
MAIKARVIDGLDKVAAVFAGLPGASAFVVDVDASSKVAYLTPDPKEDEEAFVLGRFREMGLM